MFVKLITAATNTDTWILKIESAGGATGDVNILAIITVMIQLQLENGDTIASI